MKTTVDQPGPRFLTWLAMLALAASPAAHALLAVDNVRAEQRTDSKLVDIDFDVTGTTTPVTVSLEISDDGGITWAVPATTTLTGSDIGSNITPASDLHITWDAGVDWNKKQSSLRFRILVADSSDPFALIPAGTFTMGDALDKDTNAPTHAVTVSSFFMQKKEVSQTQWAKVRDWALKNTDPDTNLAKVPYTNLATGAGKADTNHPIENVTWYDVVKWCNAKSEKEGLTPCYYTDPAQTKATIYRIDKKDIANTWVKWDADGYRLPTEAEWEKAARGGLSGKRFPWGDTINHSQANYYVYSSDGKANFYSYDVSTTLGYNPTYKTGTKPYTAPVGSFAANGYGLYDMAGNVREWCWDRYGEFYYTDPTMPSLNPRGPETGTNRMLRGGDWISTAHSSRVAYRYSGGKPSTIDNVFGFRPVHQIILSSNSSDSVAIDVDTREWQLTISPSSHGKITADATNGVYLPGSTASLTAVPDTGYAFTGWTGADTSNDNPLSLTMDSNKTIGATFKLQCTLTISALSNGSITGIAAGGKYTPGVIAKLTPVPATGYGFTGWTGADTSKDNPLSLTMDSNKTIGATFTRQYTLTISALSNGSIFGGGPYLPGATATLTPNPNPGYVFTGWTGASTSTTNPLELKMDADKTLGATFAPDYSDTDGDNLTNYDESVTYGTDPTKSDTDGDRLKDGWEAGFGRFSIILGRFTWKQARDDAHSRGGELACFPSLARWNRAMESTAAPADSYTGLWIGASDASKEGTWTWVNGEAFSYSQWATGKPSTTFGNTLDYVELSGIDGKWNDRSPTYISGGYILETGYATDPTKADTDGDGFNDACEVEFGGNPLSATTVPGFNAHSLLVPAEGRVLLSFPAQQGQSYTVETSTDLMKWDPVESNIIGRGDVITRSYPTGDIPRQFFRVQKN